MLYKRDVEEIRLLRRNATRKIRRLKLKGMQTDFIDPRKPVGAERSMERAEINAYKNALRRFNSRENSYVQGSVGRPISGKLWGEYVRERDKAAKELERHNSRIAKLPHYSGMTIEQRMAMIKPIHPELHDPAANSYWWMPKATSRAFPSNAALKKAIKKMKERQDPEFLRKQMKQNRKIASQLLLETGDAPMAARVQKLSDFQFDLLWRFTTFTGWAASRYEHYKKNIVEKYKSFDSLANENIEDAVDWAEQQQGKMLWESGPNGQIKARRRK